MKRKQADVKVAGMSVLRLSLVLAQLERSRNEYIIGLVHVRTFGNKDWAKGWRED